MSQVHEVTDATFEDEVLKSPVPVLIDFWAPWCGPCRTLGPVVDAVAAQRGAALKVVKINADQNPQTMAQFGVRGIPALFLIRDGKIAGQTMGAQTQGALGRWIDESLANPATKDTAIADKRAAADKAATEDARKMIIRIRPLYLAWNALQVTGGVLAATAAATPVAAALGAGMAAYGVVRAVQSVWPSQSGAGRKKELMDKLKNGAGHGAMMPYYGKLGFSALGNAVVLAGGLALFGLSGSFAVAALGVAAAVKGGLGMAAGLARMAVISRLPAAVEAEKRRGAARDALSNDAIAREIAKQLGLKAAATATPAPDFGKAAEGPATEQPAAPETAVRKDSRPPQGPRP